MKWKRLVGRPYFASAKRVRLIERRCWRSAQSTIHHSDRVDRFAFMLQTDELLYRIRTFPEIYGESVEKSSHCRI